MVSLEAFKTWKNVSGWKIFTLRYFQKFSWVVKRGQNYVYAVIECLLSLHFINVSVQCKHKFVISTFPQYGQRKSEQKSKSPDFHHHSIKAHTQEAQNLHQ